MGGELVRQRTIAEKVSCTGVGLHSGAPVELTLHPARVDSGVVFVSHVRGRPVEIPARPDQVSSTALATSLGRGEARVSTVEHLLAAFYGLGIDNVRVELQGPELPIMDGSAASFTYLVQTAGVFEQRAMRRVLRVRRPVEIVDGRKRIRVEPSHSFRVSYAIDFAHPAIRKQAIHGLAITPESFERELARARTFGFLHEVQALWRAGLARGGSLENTIVLDERRVLNPEGLRFPDEFVRHKVLDLLGDFALLGMPLQAAVTVERGGHALHQRLIAELLADPTAYEVVGPPRRPGFGLDLGAHELEARLGAIA